jgi:hypothetical protein
MPGFQRRPKGRPQGFLFSPLLNQLRFRAFYVDGSYMNRRNRLRFSTDMFVTITGVDDPDVSMKGRLANLSAHGLSLILPGKVPSGITVNVEWGEYHVQGRLIYCQSYGNEYRVGLQVDDPIYEPTIAVKNEKASNTPHSKIQSK